jgi:hypothetical protein
VVVERLSLYAQPVRIPLPSLFCLVLLAVLSACASTSVEFFGDAPKAPLCPGQAEGGRALVLWGTQWRPNQKDIALREAAAEQGLEEYFAQSRCYSKPSVRRVDVAEPITAEQAKRLANASDTQVTRVLVIAVRELGPIVKLLSSAALIEGGTEVLLSVSLLELREPSRRQDFVVHWKNAGPGVVRGVATLPQDMRAALAAGLE